MNIQAAVIFGGRSVEHEVSVITGMQVLAALDRAKYDPIPLYIAKDGVLYSGEEFGRIETYRDLPKALDPSRAVTLSREGGKAVLRPVARRLFGPDKPVTIDVAIPAVHGTFAEDGSLQGLLELLNIPYCGCDVLSSAICMDKPSAKALLRGAGLPVLPDVLLERTAYHEDPEGAINTLEAALPYPLIVKPANLGSSVGIGKARDRASLRNALDLAFSFANRVLAEPAVEPLREINAAVLGDANHGIDPRASVCEEPVGQDEVLSYADKYQSGSHKGMSGARRVIPAELSPEMTSRLQGLAADAFRALGCAGVVRVDFLLDGGETPYINELNTLPGSMAFYLWEKTGLPFAKLLDELVSLAFARHRGRAALTFTQNTNLLATAHFGKGKAGS